MAYLTYYEIEVLNLDGSPIGGRITEMLSGVSPEIENEIRQAVSGERRKWYDWHDHMTAISKLLPGVILAIHGEGEDSEDSWYYWYYRGNRQGGHVQMIRPTLDLETLKKGG